MSKAIILSVAVTFIGSTLAGEPDSKSHSTSLANTPLLDPDCECSPQGGICHPPSAKNCCNGFTCHFEPNGDYGLCQPPDAKTECLVEGAHHCNIPGLSCCPGTKCKRVNEGESPECVKDTDTDSYAGNAQKPLIPADDTCERNSCIAGGYNCHPSRSKGNCSPSPCCDGFTCIDLLGIGEPYCLKMDSKSEFGEAIKSASGVGGGVKNEKGATPVPSHERLSGFRRVSELFRGLIA